MSDTKKIWGRIGMTFHLTEEEFHTLQEGGDDAAELIFQKVKSGEALLDGDTYFPSPEDGACSYDPRSLLLSAALSCCSAICNSSLAFSRSFSRRASTP